MTQGKKSVNQNGKAFLSLKNKRAKVQNLKSQGAVLPRGMGVVIKNVSGKKLKKLRIRAKGGAVPPSATAHASASDNMDL